MRGGSADLAIWDQGPFPMTLPYVSLDHSLLRLLIPNKVSKEK